jgi:hypothetical protein
MGSGAAGMVGMSLIAILFIELQWWEDIRS